ncbi:glycogen/starch synthase [Ichthyobacterium seriolicida]|uniref:starch synthase n=1 Tax=Ichthyobacterium seriolicida TaxID=242600 RepID=A0A1J1DXJ7_9FLAO|nr:glycogen/starch synthase [Ichthyobacterium seriolicida]BAV94553.1 glycogen synthase GlgA-like protein [Ichthyobacterium seriolicida]
MKKKKILFVSYGVNPYVNGSVCASESFKLLKKVNSAGNEVRMFMPRYGHINERKYQLHEVIRLSGMNIVVDDTDHPLIVKVASIPNERLQVYFIDNEEYFKRKKLFEDDKGIMFKDNDERILFFIKSVLETVKNSNWIPDIIHIHGWLGYLLPFYLNTHYKNDPAFSSIKIVVSVYNDYFHGVMDSIADKMKYDGIPNEKIGYFDTADYSSLLKSAIDNSHFVIKGELEEFDDNIKNILEKYPDLDVLQSPEDDKEYVSFYQELYAKDM